MNAGKSLGSRLVATHILCKVLCQGQSLTQALNTPSMLALSTEDSALTQALCFGVLRYYENLVWIKNQYLQKPLPKQNQDIDILLLIGLYQLIHTRIQTYASVNETVAVAKRLNKPWATKLVNGIMRAYLRSDHTIEKDKPQSAQYLQPTWLLKLLQQHYPDRWTKICKAASDQAQMTLRINPAKTDRASYLVQLASCDMKAQATTYSQVGITLEKAVNVTSLPGFNQGLVSVQDEAGQLAAGLLELQPGLRVLDACAAPGSKTTHILETEPSLATCVALDNHPERLKLLTQNLTRLNLQATCIQADALKPHTWWDKLLFDRILLDAPCSATGVIRRHPDIKRLRRAEDIPALAKTQRALLKALWPLLKPGGRLVYATCSILPEENDVPIQQVLPHLSGATIQKYDAAWGIATPVGRQILPEIKQMDGFYYAILTKQKMI